MRNLRTANANCTAPKPLQCHFGHQKTGALRVEPRRALALFRALTLGKNLEGAAALLRFGGRSVETRDGALAVSAADCSAVANRLRKAGYPLNDDGIRLFKMERGYSNAVRIGPSIAAAYARYVAGRDARLAIGPDRLATLNGEQRIAVAILVRMARDPRKLAAVSKKLGLEPTNGTLEIDETLAAQLIASIHAAGHSLDLDGLVELARLRGAKNAAIDESLVDFVTDMVLYDDDPVHDYRRVERDGHVLNRRTELMLADAEGRLLPGLTWRVCKGSYVASSRRGAHPHQGGGVIDLVLSDPSPKARDCAVAALREAGFAAWVRQRGSRSHLHAVAIGDRELAPAAAWQIKSYASGCDGRSRSQPDPHASLAIHAPGWVKRHLQC